MRMKHMRIAPITAGVLLVVASSWTPASAGDITFKPMGDWMCGGRPCGSSSPTNSQPAYDYEAEHRAREAAEAERKRQEAEREQLRRAEENRRRLEEIERQKKFFEERDLVARTLKGSAGSEPKGGNEPELKGTGAIVNISTELRGVGPDSGLKTGFTQAPNTDPLVVDARNVPSGLPKAIEESLPKTPAGERLRKGFQAIMNHDWKVALAWFKDAARLEPNDPGIERLALLADYMVLRQGQHPFQNDPAISPEAKEEIKKTLLEINEYLVHALEYSTKNGPTP